MFYLICRNLEERTALIKSLKDNGVTAPFHYLSLHKSDYYQSHSSSIPELPNCDRYADCLVRLPMYFELTDDQIKEICELIHRYYGSVLS